MVRHIRFGVHVCSLEALNAVQVKVTSPHAMPFFVEAGFNLNLIARIGSVWLPIMRHSQSKGILPSEDNSW
jgi:hypothetical protein